MLKRLLAVWSTYWTSDDAIVSAVASMILFAFSLLIGALNSQTGTSSTAGSETSIGWYFSLIGLGIGGARVVGHLSTQFAADLPQSKLTPNYADPHLLIAGLLFCVLSGAAVVGLRAGGATWSMTILGVSLVGGYVIVGTEGVFSFGLRKVLNWMVQATVWALLYLFQTNSTGTVASAIQPWHAGIGLLSMLSLVALAANGLVTSRGDSFELGTEGGQRSVVENIDPSLSRRAQIAKRKWLLRLLYPELRGYHGGNWFRRLQLWQVGGSVGPLTPLIVVGVYIAFFFMRDVSMRHQAQFTLGVFFVSLLVALNVYQRPERFTLEWLRPVSRQAAVGDFLRGIAWDLLGIPLLVLVALVGHLLVDGAGLSGTEWLAPILAGPAIYVLCVGVVSLLTLNGFDIMLGGLLLLFLLPIVPMVAPFGPPDRRVVSSAVLIAIELGMTLTGVGLIALAHHRWLHRELK